MYEYFKLMLDFNAKNSHGSQWIVVIFSILETVNLFQNKLLFYLRIMETNKKSAIFCNKYLNILAITRLLGHYCSGK